jgi:hypothetical protein
MLLASLAVGGAALAGGASAAQADVVCGNGDVCLYTDVFFSGTSMGFVGVTPTAEQAGTPGYLDSAGHFDASVAGQVSSIWNNSDTQWCFFDDQYNLVAQVPARSSFWNLGDANDNRATIALAC